MRILAVAAAAAVIFSAAPASAQRWNDGYRDRGWSHQDGRWDRDDGRRWERHDGRGGYRGHASRRWQGPRHAPVAVEVERPYPVYVDRDPDVVVVEKHVYVHHVNDVRVRHVARKPMHRKVAHKTVARKATCRCK